MQSLKFSVDSWHYRFIKKYTSTHDSDVQDICAYVRAFIKAGLIVLLILAAVTFASFLGTQILVGVAFSLYNWMWIFSPVAEAGMILLTVFSSGIGILAGTEYYKQKSDEKRWREGPKPDGFVKNAYKSWKGKYCARVEIIRPEFEDGPAEI